MAALLWPKPNPKAALSSYRPRPAATLTFNKDIAPIFFQNCSGCHRPTQSGPFAILSYADAKEHGKQIAEVTRKRVMPPWKPEPGLVEYLDERRLTVDQIGMVQQWFAEGMHEGDPSDLPALPQFANGWQLGQPDLVIEMPEAYTLPAEGKDVYRNFVIPIPIDGPRFVDAVEFRPNAQVVHHAAIRLDNTRMSRKLDEQSPEPGFEGMTMPETTYFPNGQFLNWQPGKSAYHSPEGYYWTLGTNTDLVLQLHMKPSGKAEAIQASVGFYFTDKAPTRQGFKLILDNPTIDIPAGEANYKLKDSYTLPVDAELTTIFPHAHYLAREMQSYAILPDGTKRWLIDIKDWDFNWQGDYRFAQPIVAPKGSVLHMEFTYDNSTNNVRNPNHPPKRVQFGLQTTDEMGELWIQALPASPHDLSLLAEDFSQQGLLKMVKVGQHRVQKTPKDAKAHLDLAKTLVGMERLHEALKHLNTAVTLQPKNEEAHYFLGVVNRLNGNRKAARSEFEATLQLNASHYKAHGNLGMLDLEDGKVAPAESHFQEALRINPEDPLAREKLERIALFRREGKIPLTR